MAATVGELVVNLVARTAKFAKGMRESGTRVSAFSTKVRAAAKRMAMFGATMVGVASVGGIAVMIKKNLALMDSTGKLADRIGITTEALQGLRHAAELTGAGADTLDAGLQTMAKRLGEAARGAGAAGPALDLIGVSIDDLLKLSPDKQFIAIAEGISKLGTHTERAAAAANIFSKGNMALINTLAEGRGGIEAMQAEAAALGKTFSRETAAKAEAANDAILNLTTSMSGAATSAVADLTDAIKGLAEAMSEVPESSRNFRAWLLETLAATRPGYGLGGDYAAEFQKQLLVGADQLRKGHTGGLAAKRAAVKARIAREGAGAERLATGAGFAQRPRFGENWGWQPGETFADRARKAREGNIRSILSGIVGGAGGDGGYSLSGAAAKGSAAAYSAIVNRGLGSAKERTEKEMLAEARKRLRVQEETKRVIEELTRKLTGEEDVERVIL